MGGSGFIFRCLLRCPAQLGGRLTTVCLPRLRPAVVWFTLLLQVLLFCCGLRHRLCPAAESLCCSRLPRHWQAASAVDLYLSRDGLPRQWLAASAVGVYLSRDSLPRHQLAASVGAGCLRNGGRPSPSERLGQSARGLFEIAVLFVPLSQP